MERKHSCILGIVAAISLVHGLPADAGPVTTSPASPATRPSAEDKICGHSSLVIGSHLLGRPVSFRDLVEFIPPQKSGVSLSDLEIAARHFGIPATTAKLTPEQLGQLDAPAILHVNGNHFILVSRRPDGQTAVVDAPDVWGLQSVQQLTRWYKWDGLTLILASREQVFPALAANGPGQAGWAMLGGGAALLVVGAMLLIRSRGYKTMKPAISMLFLLAVCLPACDRGQKTVPEGPRLSVANPRFDAGEIFEETAEIRHAFKLTNSGSAPLLIRNITKGCSCTTSILQQTELAPGAELPLAVTVDTRRADGPVVRKLTLITNDPVQPEHTVEMKYNRKHTFESSPQIIQFGRLNTTDPGDVRVVVRVNREGRELDTGRIQVDPPFIHVQPGYEKIGAFGSYVFHLQVPAGSPISRFDGTLRVAARPGAPDLTLPVRGEIVGAVKAVPSNVFLGTIRLPCRQALSETVRIKPEGETGGNLKLTGVSSTSEWLTAKVDAAGTTLAISTVLDKLRPGRLSASVNVQGEANAKPFVISVPVLAFGTGAADKVQGVASKQ